MTDATLNRFRLLRAALVAVVPLAVAAVLFLPSQPPQARPVPPTVALGAGARLVIAAPHGWTVPAGAASGTLELRSGACGGLGLRAYRSKPSTRKDAIRMLGEIEGSAFDGNFDESRVTVALTHGAIVGARLLSDTRTGAAVLIADPSPELAQQALVVAARLTQPERCPPGADQRRRFARMLATLRVIHD